MYSTRITITLKHGGISKMTYDPKRAWNIAATEITLPDSDGYFLYIKVPTAAGENTSEFIVDKGYVVPSRDAGYFICPWGYIHPPVEGVREYSPYWGNKKGVSLEKATGAEVTTGTNDLKYVTPKAIKDSDIFQSSAITIKNAEQIEHGFSIGDAIRNSPDGWVKSQADSRYNSGTLGLVSEIIDVNTFTFISCGLLHGEYIKGNKYYLSPNEPGKIDLLENLSFSPESIVQYVGTGTESGLLIEIDYGHEIIQKNITNAFEYDISATTWLDDKLMTTTELSAPTSYWESISCDETGQYVVAGAVNGRLYTSSDFGDTWTERQPAGNTDRLWRSVKYNHDASILVAADVGGRLWKSINQGASWTEMQPVGNINKNWNVFAMSRTGEFMIAGVLYGRIYKSNDFGVTWSELHPESSDSDFNWFIADISEDGEKIIIGSNQIGECYFSADGGSSFDNLYYTIGFNDNELIQTAKVNADGMKLIIGIPTVGNSDGQDEFGYFMSSIDGGLSWYNEYEIPEIPFSHSNFAMSRNGKYIATFTHNSLCLSEFKLMGAWTFHKQRGSTINQSAIAISENGSMVFISAFAGKIHRITFKEIITEAPKDNKIYGRKNGEWVEII